MPRELPAWVGETERAAMRMEQAAQEFLKTRGATATAIEAHDAEAVLRLSRGIRRKMEGWRLRPRDGTTSATT